jgi:general secretion pathway protein E
VKDVEAADQLDLWARLGPVLEAVRGDSGAQASSEPIFDRLSSASGIPPQDIVRAIAARLDWRLVETSDLAASTFAADRLPLAKALPRDVALVRDRDGRLLAVTHDPFDRQLLLWLDAHAGRQAAYALATRPDIRAYLASLEEGTRAFSFVAAGNAEPAAQGRSVEVIEYSQLADDSSQVVRIVNSTLYDALKEGASDVHVEATPGGLAVRFRIDGVLVDVASPLAGTELAEQVISRIKVLAELDIAERRVPQDGSFRVHARGRDIDIRVSVMPSVHGEDAVLRILDKAHLMKSVAALNLGALGFDAGSLRMLRRLAAEPYGMLLVTGPTGSGKTTTLYGLLSELNKGREKIITIEDPVEYQMPRILQIPVNEKKGLSFARGLRSILRHDPDIIMVGEIRDAETAQIAVQSALTGHLVLATLHANNGFDAFGRFEHLGIEPYSLVSALNGIWAQRLIRLNCQRCAQPYAPSSEELDLAGLAGSGTAGYDFKHGTGCGDCRGTGFRGRQAIAEFVSLDETMRRLIVDRAPIDDMRNAGSRAGMRTLRELALELVAAGATTLEEAKRVALHA